MKKIEQFDKYMKFKGLNDNKVTQQLGLSTGTIGKSRKENRDLSDKNIELILNFYTDLNRTWLLTGEGEMLKPQQQPSVTQTNVNGNNNYIGGSSVNINTHAGACEEDIPYADQVPVVPPTVVKQAGVDILEYVRDNMGVVEKSSVVVNDMQLTTWIPMPDDCMAPEIQKGDRLGLWAYPRGNENPIPGKIYALDTMSNGTIVRYLYLTPEGDYIMRSQNPTIYPDFVVKKSDVIAVYKKLIMVRI